MLQIIVWVPAKLFVCASCDVVSKGETPNWLIKESPTDAIGLVLHSVRFALLIKSTVLKTFLTLRSDEFDDSDSCVVTVSKNGIFNKSTRIL